MFFFLTACNTHLQYHPKDCPQTLRTLYIDPKGLILTVFFLFSFVPLISVEIENEYKLFTIASNDFTFWVVTWLVPRLHRRNK